MALHYITSQEPETNYPKNNNNNDVLTILVHGGALSSRMYRTLTPYLSSPWVAVDLPGHGKSVQLGPFTFARSTELLKRLIEDNLQQQQQQHHRRIALVGISLGGQAVRDLVLTHPGLVHTAIVSGVSIHPPDATAAWEMPHMPTEQAWLDAMAEDVAVIGGMDAAVAIQGESFAFSIDERQAAAADDCCYPPVLVCVGEHDVAMAKRDFPDLVTQLKALNPACEGRVLEGAFHNHSIDVPELFAEVVSEWIAKVS